MKTKEQWLEEFRNTFIEYTDGGTYVHYSVKNEHIDDFFSTALEQYAKEYCLGVIERATKNIPTSMITKAYFLSGIQEAESAMKKEIGV